MPPLDRRSAEAILRPVGGVGDIQVVGAIDETILRVCQIQTSARSVWLHQSVTQHIYDRRGITTADAEFALQYLPAGVLRPDFFGLDRRDSRGRKVDLVHLVREVDDRPLYIALKFVSAEDADSYTDEIWVSTAYPIARNFLTRNRYKDTLQPVRRKP